MPKKAVDQEQLKALRAEIETAIGNKESISKLQDAAKIIQPKLDAFKLLVDEEVKICEETPQKRTLYADIELLRIDWNELEFNERLESIQTKLKSMKNKDTIQDIIDLSTILEYSEAFTISNGIYTQFNKFRQDLRIQSVGTSQFKRMLYAIRFAVWIFLVTHICLLAAPLQLLDPILRKHFGFKTHQLPVDRMHYFFTSSTLFWCGTEMYWEKDSLKNADDKSKSYIQMYTHASSYDAFCLCTGPTPIRLFGKKSLFFIPYLGWLGWAWNHIILNRDNLEEAKKSIDRAVNQLTTSQRSLAISPEGTRSRTGRISDFRKGAFHMALAAKLPIQPVMLMNPGMFWGGSEWTPSPGRIYGRILPEIRLKDGENYKELRDRVHRTFLEAYKKPIGPSVSANNDLVNFLALPVCYFVTKYFYSTLFSVISSLF